MCNNLGESILVESFTQYPGGKGANQSVALANFQSDVYHIGKIGKDGIWLKDLMSSYGVETSNVIICNNNLTGKAIIQVNENGDNAILVHAGANGALNFDEMSARMKMVLETGGFLLLQNELNVDVSAKASEIAKEFGKIHLMKDGTFA